MFTNGPVDWSFRLLKIATSSCQAETAAGCVAAKRNTFLRNLLGHSLYIIGTKLNGGVTVSLRIILRRLNKLTTPVPRRRLSTTISAGSIS
eukprot:6191667-Pleurochrysis_carterae.AAC.1